MASEETPSQGDRGLLLDELDERLDAFNAFRKSDGGKADEILGDLGASDTVDRDIILELAGRRPLGHPLRFPAAHSMAIRSLEVLDRNGARGVKTRIPGPLDPIANYFVHLVTRFVVRNHQKSLVDNMRRLYARREANCLPDDPSRHVLTRARKHVELVSEGFRRNPVGVPTFLLGGAVFSTAISAASRAIVDSVDSRWTRLVLSFGLILVLGAVSWVILRGAAVARRRIVLTTERPFRALYQTIGRCGDPPKDQSRQFALIAMVLLAISWILIPFAFLGILFE